MILLTSIESIIPIVFLIALGFYLYQKTGLERLLQEISQSSS